MHDGNADGGASLRERPSYDNGRVALVLSAAPFNTFCKLDNAADAKVAAVDDVSGGGGAVRLSSKPLIRGRYNGLCATDPSQTPKPERFEVFFSGPLPVGEEAAGEEVNCFRVNPCFLDTRAPAVPPLDGKGASDEARTTLAKRLMDAREEERRRRRRGRQGNSDRAFVGRGEPCVFQVERFSRSAAGKVLEPDRLRTPLSLEKTMHFLVQYYLRSPHTPLCFTDPFTIWGYLWDRLRSIRTTWVPQLPLCSAGFQGYEDESSGQPLDPAVLAKESRRRMQWLEFAVATLSVGAAYLCRTVDGCQRFVEEKKNFLESISQCFTDLTVWYRVEQRARNGEFVSLLLLLYGLNQESKAEDRAAFCTFRRLSMLDGTTVTVPEPAGASVNLTQVYKELEKQPYLIHTQPVGAAVKLINAWATGSWFGFFYLCRHERLTPLQRCLVFQSFTYARLRATLDLVVPTNPVYPKLRWRNSIPLQTLSELLMMQEVRHCVSFLAAMGLGELVDEARGVLALSQPASAPLVTAAAVEERCSNKTLLSFPTHAAFFGFRVWQEAFERFPQEEFCEGDDEAIAQLRAATQRLHAARAEALLRGCGSTQAAAAVDEVVQREEAAAAAWEHRLLQRRCCPINLMETLEAYCPPYNEDVAGLQLIDIPVSDSVAFGSIEAHREAMLLRCFRRNHAAGWMLLGPPPSSSLSADGDGGSSLAVSRVKTAVEEMLDAFEAESVATEDDCFMDDVDPLLDDAVTDRPLPRASSRAAGDDDDDAGKDETDDDEALASIKASRTLLSRLEHDEAYSRVQRELDDAAATEQRARQEKEALLQSLKAQLQRQQRERQGQGAADTAGERGGEEEKEEEEGDHEGGNAQQIVGEEERRRSPPPPLQPQRPLALPATGPVVVTPLPTDYRSSLSHPATPAVTTAAIVESPKSAALPVAHTNVDSVFPRRSPPSGPSSGAAAAWDGVNADSREAKEVEEAVGTAPPPQRSSPRTTAPSAVAASSAEVSREPPPLGSQEESPAEYIAALPHERVDPPRPPQPPTTTTTTTTFDGRPSEDREGPSPYADFSHIKPSRLSGDTERAAADHDDHDAGGDGDGAADPLGFRFRRVAVRHAVLARGSLLSRPMSVSPLFRAPLPLDASFSRGFARRVSDYLIAAAHHIGSREYTQRVLRYAALCAHMPLREHGESDGGVLPAWRRTLFPRPEANDSAAAAAATAGTAHAMEKPFSPSPSPFSSSFQLPSSSLSGASASPLGRRLNALQEEGIAAHRLCIGFNPIAARPGGAREQPLTKRPRWDTAEAEEERGGRPRHRRGGSSGGMESAWATVQRVMPPAAAAAAAVFSGANPTTLLSQLEEEVMPMLTAHPGRRLSAAGVVEAVRELGSRVANGTATGLLRGDGRRRGRGWEEEEDGVGNGGFLSPAASPSPRPPVGAGADNEGGGLVFHAAFALVSTGPPPSLHDATDHGELHHRRLLDHPKVALARRFTSPFERAVATLLYDAQQPSASSPAPPLLPLLANAEERGTFLCVRANGTEVVAPLRTRVSVFAADQSAFAGGRLLGIEDDDGSPSSSSPVDAAAAEGGGGGEGVCPQLTPLICLDAATEGPRGADGGGEEGEEEEGAADGASSSSSSSSPSSSEFFSPTQWSRALESIDAVLRHAAVAEAMRRDPSLSLPRESRPHRGGVPPTTRIPGVLLLLHTNEGGNGAGAFARVSAKVAQAVAVSWRTQAEALNRRAAAAAKNGKGSRKRGGGAAVDDGAPSWRRAHPRPMDSDGEGGGRWAVRRLTGEPLPHHSGGRGGRGCEDDDEDGGPSLLPLECPISVVLASVSAATASSIQRGLMDGMDALLRAYLRRVAAAVNPDHAAAAKERCGGARGDSETVSGRSSTAVPSSVSESISG